MIADERLSTDAAVDCTRCAHHRAIDVQGSTCISDRLGSSS